MGAGGRAGNFLFDLSRERPKMATAMYRSSRKAKITLTTISVGWRTGLEQGGDRVAEEASATDDEQSVM